MQLSDLPYELVLQALPVRECFLDWPSEIVISCLNLFSQVELFELMAEVAYGSTAFKDSRKVHAEIPWVDVRQNIAIFARRFANKIYINTGNRLPSRLYKKYIIFDLEVVKDLAAQYYFFTAILQIWTGDEYLHEYVMLPYYSFKDPLTLHVLSATNREPIFNSGLFNIVKCKAFKALQDLSIWGDKLWSIHTVEVRMSVEKYNEIFGFTTYTGSLSLEGKLKPNDLRVYISDQTKSLGLSTVSAFHVWKVFGLDRVRTFSLQCSVTNAELTYLDLVLEYMPSLTYLNVRFGNLDFARIPRMIGWRGCLVQVTIDRTFYDSRQDQCDRELWDILILDNVVTLMYATRCNTKVPFATKYPIREPCSFFRSVCRLLVLTKKTIEYRVEKKSSGEVRPLYRSIMKEAKKVKRQSMEWCIQKLRDIQTF